MKLQIRILLTVFVASFLGNPVHADERYTINLGTWEKFITEPPVLYLLNRPDRDTYKLIQTQEEAIQKVLDTTLPLEGTREYGLLKDKFHILLSVITGSESERTYTPYDPDGYAKLSGRTRASFQQIARYTQNCSSQLSGSVENNILNMTMENIDERIDVLNKVIEQWTKRTELMSSNGSTGKTKRANEGYLGIIRDYTNELSELSKELKSAHQSYQSTQARRPTYLADWKIFAEQDLPTLLEKVSTESEHIYPNDQNEYVISDDQKRMYPYAYCQIGQFNVLFGLKRIRNAEHPIRLVSVE